MQESAKTHQSDLQVEALPRENKQFEFMNKKFEEFNLEFNHKLCKNNLDLFLF